MIPPEPTAASAGYASEALPCLVESGLAVAMIGVGGMGMTPLAIYLSQSGVRVMGYDDNLRPPVRELLESAGVALLDNPELPEDAGMVVRSSAVKETHPALREAARRGTAVLRRGEALARLATGKRLVAVVGSHGKTTTTGMLIWALRESGFTCDYVLGGLFNADVSPACACGSPWLVAEVDESDGTLEGFHPEVTVAVNFDWDHPDQYPTEEALAAAFARIFERTRDAVILHENDQENFTRAGGGWTEKMLTVGEGRDYCGRMAGREGFTLELTLGGRFRMERCQVGAAGAFNARNALMALAAGVHMGASLGDGALASFPGICRRQTVLFDQPGWTVLEDYAHHPSEIDALLESSREAFPDRQMVVVFQPHRYTRTLLYRDAFAASLAQADTVFLLDVYAACEPRLEGGETTDILARMKGGTSVARATSRSGLEAALAKLADAPGVVLFVGAGDIEEWATAYVESLSLNPQPVTPKPMNACKTAPWWTNLREAVSPETLLAEEEPLARKTTLGVGGPAKYYAEPVSSFDLRSILEAAEEASVPVFFLGRGSNLVVLDSGFDGLVIRLSQPHWQEIESLCNGRYFVGAGVRLKQLCARACSEGVVGFEFLEGIPGSVGGALRMNAGAMGGWIFDSVESIDYMTPSGERRILGRHEFSASYRQCTELTGAIALGATLRGQLGSNTEAIRAQIDEFATRRRATQPREPSAGCIFKNPDPAIGAGQLIDEGGLKGRACGQASVSTVHGNFIVNAGGASSDEVIGLVREIRKEVASRTGYLLEPEVLLLGAKWEDVL